MTKRIAFGMKVGMGKIQELRDILKSKIESKAITQTGLAKATDVDQASINRFYKKGEGLSAENFIRLSEWAGARIVWPGEEQCRPPGYEHEIEKLRDKVESLTRENALLHKLVNKYEDQESVDRGRSDEEELRARRTTSALTPSASGRLDTNTS